ncbi:cytokinesis regulator, partial [Rhizoctonia solani]
MSATVPAPAPSFVITRTEEWPEADFDLPDDQETFAIDNEGDEQADPGNRIKGSRPSLSGAGAVAKLGGAPVEDEDWDAEFEDAPSKVPPPQPRKTKENVEDWSDDGDLELPEPSHTNFTLARAPLPQPNVPDTEDAGDVSTIKIAKHNFPSVAKKSSTKPVEEDDFEADFALPAEMSNLSLRILTPQTSSLSLRKSSTLVEGNGPWGELTTSTSTYSDTSSLLSLYPPDASPSTSSALNLAPKRTPLMGTLLSMRTRMRRLRVLILPEGLAGKNLAKHLETKKQIVPAQIAAENDAKGSLTSQSRRTANETEDFESGLVIGDEDISITRLRLRRMANPAEYRSKSVPLPRTGSGSYRPSSSSRLRPESVMEVLSASKVPTISRSRSPSSVSQRSLSKKDSRSSLVSPTNFSSLRPSSVRASSSSHASPSTANLLSIPSPSSISGIAPRTAPLKHQKSLGRLQLSSTSSSTSTTLGVKLGRKASLASLADPSSSITPSSTLSTRPSGFGAPTASSKARQKPEPRDEVDKKSSGRPTTHRPVQSIPRRFATAPADRATSPQPNPRRTPTSPRRIRTRSGASNGGTPSSSISSMASATAPKVMRKPKRIQAFSDGTELDAFDDLPEDTEKERKFRVQPAGRGNVSSSRGEKGSSASTTSGGLMDKIRQRVLESSPSAQASGGFPGQGGYPEPTPRRKKPTVTAIGGPRKKPMLIRNLGGAGTAKTVGDMKWNPKTLRWEGNEQVLKEFDAHAAPSRPALITHLTGSSIGGSCPLQDRCLLAVRVSRLPPEEEEPDVFAGLADDEGDWEDKAGTIRANTGAQMPRMTARTGRGRESEAGDTPSARGTRRGGRQSFGGQSVHEEVPGVDDALVAACRAAEERHKQEMKGWYIRSRSRSRSVKSSTEAEEAPVRTHLFDILFILVPLSPPSFISPFSPVFSFQIQMGRWGSAAEEMNITQGANPNAERTVFGSTDGARPLLAARPTHKDTPHSFNTRRYQQAQSYSLIRTRDISETGDPRPIVWNFRFDKVFDDIKMGYDDHVRGLLNSRCGRSGVPATLSPTPTADAFSLTSPRHGPHTSPHLTERSESPSCYSHQMSIDESSSDISDDISPYSDSSDDERTEAQSESDVQASASNDTLSDNGMLRPVESDTSVSSALSAEAESTPDPRLSFLGGGWARTSSDTRPSVDSSKRSMESSVASYIQTPTSPRNGSFSDAIRGVGGRSLSSFSASSAASSGTSAVQSIFPGIRPRGGSNAVFKLTRTIWIPGAITAGASNDGAVSPSRSNSSATLTASTLPLTSLLPPRQREASSPSHCCLAPGSRASYTQLGQVPSALSISFVPTSPPPMSASAGDDVVVPCGMLAFPGSPACNLISLEQAQMKVRDRSRSITSNTSQFPISPRPKEVIHKKSKPTLGPIGGGFSSTISSGEHSRAKVDQPGTPMETAPPKQLKAKRSGFLKFFKNGSGSGSGNPNISAPSAPFHVSHNGMDMPPVLRCLLNTKHQRPPWPSPEQVQPAPLEHGATAPEVDADSQDPSFGSLRLRQ